MMDKYEKEQASSPCTIPPRYFGARKTGAGSPSPPIFPAALRLVKAGPKPLRNLSLLSRHGLRQRRLPVTRSHNLRRGSERSLELRAEAYPTSYLHSAGG